MKNVILVAHGQPSDPLPIAAELEALAKRVAVHLPDHHLRAATLAEDGALARAVAGLSGGVIFPLFMAAGWFTQTAIPKRLAEIGAEGWHILTPFGEAAEVQALAVQIAEESGAGEVLLAAHGSFKSDAPAAVARKVVSLMKAPRAAAAFIDQEPQISQARGFGRDSICLPYFAMAGGHVLIDLPQALQEAGFAGRLLPPLGADPRVPALIASLILRG